MGSVANISYEDYPKQGTLLGQTVQVCFHYDTGHIVLGVIVRDDAEGPWLTIIRLEDGRVVLATECMYTEC